MGRATEFVSVNMNKKNKSAYMKIALLILLFAICYGRSYLAYTKLQRNFDCISVRIQDQAVTKKQLIRAQELMKEQEESHIPEIAAYSITEHTSIGEPALERTTEVNLYQVYGQMKLVTPSECMAGNFPVTEDYDGCVIDADSAYQLFGSKDVMDHIITMNQEIPATMKDSTEAQGVDQAQTQPKVIQKKYIVRGVIQSEMPIMMIQAREEATKFWDLEFDYGNLKQGREYASQFMSSYGLSGKYVIIEGNFIGDVIGNILVLPVFILFLIVFVAEVKKIGKIKRIQMEEIQSRHYRMKKDWMRCFVSIITKSLIPLFKIAIGLVILIYAWKAFGIFPLRYLPSKWSDFDQYVRFADQIKERLNDLSYVAPTRREVLFKQNSMYCLFFGAVTILLEWHVIDLIKNTKKN